MLYYKQKGFTLLELLIVVSIIAILAGQSLSSYQTYIITTNRQEALTSLQMAQQEMEHSFLQSSSYNNQIQEKLNSFTSTSHKIQLSQSNEVSYILSAVPIKDDALCGTLSIDHTGLKSSSVNQNVSECW